MNKRVAHLTSVHRRNDTRIFEKECCSLSQAGYDVNLVVAESKGDCIEEGVAIHDVGLSRGRIGRMTGAVARVLRKARELRADLYHLHDPELIPIGLMLKRQGSKVLFDCHEDVPLQLLSKPYLPPVLRMPISRLYGQFETFSCSHFDAIVAATPMIASKLGRANSNVVVIRNFPIADNAALESPITSAQWQRKLVYVGTISKIRGIKEMIRTLEFLDDDVKLDLVGSFSDEKLYREMKSRPGWKKVNELGWLSHEAANSTMSQAMVGLLLFHPEPNHVDALPNKLFEYMSVGIPVISSNFDLWKQIVERSECGLCVDPLDPAAIADAVRRLLDDPERCETLGRNGRRAVAEEYRWSNEFLSLQQLYMDLLQPHLCSAESS